MQTIGKYVAALIIALSSSFFGPSEDTHPKEKEAQIRVRIIKSSPCVTHAAVIEEFHLLS